MNKLLFIPLFAILLIFTVSFIPADALKSQGNSNAKVGVDLCGDRLCEVGEKMTPQEKLGYYLLSLLEFEIEDDTVLQQGKYAMTSKKISSFDSTISRGQFSSQNIPTMSAKALSPPVSTPGELSPPVSISKKDFSKFTSKKFDLSARSISSLIDKYEILSEKIDFSKVKISKKLQPSYSLKDPSSFGTIGISPDIDIVLTYTGPLIWGSNGSGDGEFKSPLDVDVDSSGNVYVTDSGNYRIQVFDHNGNYKDEWGSQGSSNGKFFSPQGIAVDSNDNIHVTDVGNYRVQVFDSNGDYKSKWGFCQVGGSLIKIF